MNHYSLVRTHGSDETKFVKLSDVPEHGPLFGKYGPISWPTEVMPEQEAALGALMEDVEKGKRFAFWITEDVRIDARPAEEGIWTISLRVRLGENKHLTEVKNRGRYRTASAIAKACTKLFHDTIEDWKAKGALSVH